MSMRNVAILMFAAAIMSGCAAGQMDSHEKSCCSDNCCSAPGASHAGGTTMPATRPSASIYSIEGTWQTDDQKEVSLKDLAGKPHIIGMVFTACQGTCGVTLQHMKEIEASLPASSRQQVSFIIVSLDPSHDTPKALACYRADNALSKEHWTLLRGSPEATSKVASFLGIQYYRNPFIGIRHTSQIAVLDSNGRIANNENGSVPILDHTLAAIHESLNEVGEK